MDETDREKVLRLELEQSTSRMMQEIVEKMEQRLNARFDKFEELLGQRATPQEVKRRVAECLEEGEYVRKVDLWPLWQEYMKWHTDRTMSSFQKMVTFAKNLLWVGSGLAILAMAFDKARQLLFGK